MIRSLSNKRIYLFLAAFLVITPSLAFSQVEIKLPKVKERIKIQRGNKSNDSEKENKTSSSSASKTTENSSESGVERPQCAKNSEQKVIRFRGKIEDMTSRLETEFSDNSYQNYVRALERDSRSVENSLKNCQETNPDYDFSNDLENIQTALTAYEIFNAAYDAKSNEGDRYSKTLYTIQTCANNISYFPGYYFSEDLLALTNADLAPFKNPEGNGNASHRSAFSQGNEYIERILSAVNSPEFKEKTFAFLDLKYNDYDKEEGIEAIQIKIRDLGLLEAVFFTGNTNLTELITYAKKLESKLVSNQNQRLKEIAVSDFHLKNMNSIKFTSNVNLDPKLATESDFKTEFEAGEQIKAIAYLDQPAEKYGNNFYPPTFRLKSSSNSNSFTVEGLSAAKAKLSYIEFYISLDAANYTPTEGSPCEAAISMRFLEELPPRKHSIEIKLLEEKEPTATLTFNADNDEGMKKIAEQKMLIRDKHLANKPLPKAKMNNATYESQLVKMFNSIGWEETFKKAIITSNDWGYQKNYEGIVIGRTLSVVMVSTKNGGCMYQDFTVIQDKVGSEYSGFKLHGTGGQSDISCSKVK